MEVVPVIDLKGGVVVRARHGDRAAYRPIETPLSRSSAPVDVVAGLLSLHPFRTVYIADLDSIEGRGSHAEIISGIARAYPELSLWIDNGCAGAEAAEIFLAAHPGATLVLGAESQRDCETLRKLGAHARIILSLDFRGDAFLGPHELLENPALWPPRVIVMSLSRIGGCVGPDFGRLAQVTKVAGPRAIFSAGGVRDARDLATLAARRAAGILVASALHDGRLSAADLAPFAAPQNQKAPEVPEPSRT